MHVSVTTSKEVVSKREVLRSVVHSNTTTNTPHNSGDNDYHCQRKRQPEGRFPQPAYLRVSWRLARPNFGMMLMNLWSRPC